jgi:PAS domain S-box-containing protein
MKTKNYEEAKSYFLPTIVALIILLLCSLETVIILYKSNLTPLNFYINLTIGLVSAFLLFISLIKMIFLQKAKYINLIKMQKKMLADEITKVRLEIALESSQFGTWDLNLTTNHVERSLRHDIIYGYPALLPQWNYEIFLSHVFPEDRQRVDHALKTSIKNKGNFDVDFRIIRADKKLRWLSAKGRCVKTQNEYHVIGLIQDITKKKQIEDELHFTQERTSMIIDNIKDYAIIMLNPEGYIATWNSGAEQLHGYKTDEIIGQHISCFHSSEERRVNHPEYALDSSKKEGRYEEEGWQYRKNGTRFWANASTYPLNNHDNQLMGFVKITRDLTYRIIHQQALEEKNRALENAIMTKNKFLATMSHELRTPLNAIIGFTGILLMQLPGPINAEQEKQITTVKTSADHLLSLINDMLDIARIESGNIELHFETTDIKKLINDTASSMMPLAVAKGLKFTINTPGNEIIMETDKRTFTQIIINLISNAIKFTETGQVEIQVAEQVINNENNLVIIISDTGIGVKAEDQDRLFQPFKRIRYNGNHIEGTGLGLHLSQKLAHLLYGKIECTSEFNQGSQFTVTLPIKEHHSEARTHHTDPNLSH